MFTVLAARPADTGVEVDVHVPADCPYFRGHFPRAPVLPAVALLDLVARLARAHAETERAPLGVRGLRLRGAIAPDARLTVRLEPDAEGLAFAVRVDGGPGAQGRLLFAAEPPAELGLDPGDEQAVEAGGATTEPLLPHEGPARLVEAVLFRDAESVTCRARIPADSPFREGGGARVPALLALELAAQASAAHDQDGPGGGGAAAAAGRGFVVGVRSAWFRGATLHADVPWTVCARRLSLAPPLRNYEAVVRDPSGAPFAHAAFGTWVPG